MDNAGGGNDDDNEKNDRIVNEAMERNGMQMIEVLMARLNNLTSKVNERQKACIQDRNPDSDFCSSLVQGLQQELSDDENDDTSVSGGGKGEGTGGREKRSSVFKPRVMSREIGIPGSKRSSTPPPGTLAPGEVYVTFRGEPSTDFGKKLEHKFEQDSENAERNLSVNVGGDSAHHRRRASQGQRMREGQKKIKDTKVLRAKYEKKLLDNLEAFVSRSATDLVYVMPMGAQKRVGGMAATSPFKPPCGATLPKSALSGKNEESRHDAILRASSPSALSRGVTPSEPNTAKHTNKNQNRASLVAGVLNGNHNPPAGGEGGNQPGLQAVWNIAPKGTKNRSNSIVPYGEDGDLVQAAVNTAVASTTNGSEAKLKKTSSGEDSVYLDEQMMDAEDWPIPLVTAEFNPSLLLGLSCTKITLPAGDSLMAKFAKTELSNWLLIYMFWFIHCKSFQNDSIEEQEHLLRRASAIYVSMLTLQDKGLSRHKDFIFQHYPYLLANAIILGFHFLCPGSRHLYTHAWKRIVYLQCCKVLTGLPDICPISVLVHRNELYLEDAAEEQAFMNKEMNRALIIAAATGGVLPMNAGQVADILPPLAGQNGKDKNKSSDEHGVSGGDGTMVGKGSDQSKEKGKEEIVMPAALLSTPSEFDMEHSNSNPLAAPPAALRTEDSFAESVHSDDGQMKSPNVKKRSRFHRPNKFKFKQKGQKGNSTVNLESSFDSTMDSEEGLLASRVKGMSSQRAGQLVLDVSEKIDESPRPAHHSPKNNLERNQEYWKERRVQSLQPLFDLTGTRKSLRFNPDVPQEFKTIKNYIHNFALDEEALLSGTARTEPLARQRKVVFDQSGVSPMVQQYLEHPQPFIKGGRKPERMGRTHPVKWCVTGTSDTFVKSESRKDIHESISAQHKAALETFRIQEKKQRKELKANLRQLEDQRKAVYRGGAVSVGKYSLQLVAEISGRSNEGARKRDEKAKEKERQRLASEKERQKKAIEEQFAALSKG